MKWFYKEPPSNYSYVERLEAEKRGEACPITQEDLERYFYNLCNVNKGFPIKRRIYWFFKRNFG